MPEVSMARTIVVMIVIACVNSGIAEPLKTARRPASSAQEAIASFKRELAQVADEFETAVKVGKDRTEAENRRDDEEAAAYLHYADDLLAVAEKADPSTSNRYLSLVQQQLDKLKDLHSASIQ